MDIAGVFKIVRNMQDVVHPDHELYRIIADTMHSFQENELLEQELDYISAAASDRLNEAKFYKSKNTGNDV